MDKGQALTVDILCKVVDNYGDIGVVYRLARSLDEAAEDLGTALRLRLVVDNLESFRSLCPEVDPCLPLQEIRGWTVARWDGPQEVLAAFAATPPRLVVEAFACGRPDWFENLLFDPARPELRLVVNLEYLSAEDWADDFHLMDSLTRSSEVKKRFFMPGFTEKTGGLILDRDFLAALDMRETPGGPARLRKTVLEAALAAGGRLLAPAPTTAPTTAPAKAPAPAAALPGPDHFLEAYWVAVFSYERDYTRVVADLAAYARGPLAALGRPLLALAAAGKSQPCFLAAWEAAGRPFPVLALPFLAQEDWDSLLAASDFSIVRGEDSLSRAALSGRPFLWQAYPQEGRHHLVKVRAFLERLRPFLPHQGFETLSAAYLAFNDRDTDSPATSGEEALYPLLAALSMDSPSDAAPDRAAPMSSGPSALAQGFGSFSEALLSHGNLARPLLEILRDFV